MVNEEPSQEDGLHPAVPATSISAQSTSTSVDGLLAMAVEQGVPVETLERLLAMRTQLKAESAREAFLEALSAFQAECPVIAKGRSAGTGSYVYRYAPLEDIVHAIAPLLRKFGLSYRFDTAFEAGERGQAQVVTCIVHHRDGHSERSEFRTPIDNGARMNVMQQAASAQTYGKRYALLAALGIVVGGEDDDGQGAGGGSRRAPVAFQAASAPAAEPRAGRNLVRIPSRGVQGSDRAPSGGTSGEPDPVAATPAPPETEESELSDLRQRVIEGMMAYLRLRAQYATWPDGELWEKATATLGPWCNMSFGKGLLDLDRGELTRARAKIEQTIEEREAANA